MFWVRFTRTTTGIDELSAKINSALRAKDIADDIWQDNVDNFNKSTNPEGIPLKRLSQKRIEQKKRRGFPYPEKPMIASTQLAQAIEAFEVNPHKAYVKIMNKRFKTADNPKKNITNKELLDIHQSTRPTFGIATKRLLK